MFGKILVPLDGSNLAEVVLPYAEELASRLGYEIVLVNVRTPAEDPYHPILQSYLESMVQKTKSNVHACLAKTRGRTTKAESVIVGSGILVGHPAEGIIDYADKENVDLIVMSTHGRTGVRRWALGSVADKVVRAYERPVLLVRTNVDVCQRIKLTNILVPLDGSPQSEAVLPYIENLAAKLKTKIILLHIIAQPYLVYAGTEGVVAVPYTKEELKMKKTSVKDYLEKLRRSLGEKGIRTSTRIIVGEPAEEIIKYAKEINADIVAMSTHGRSGLSRWEHGSVADKVLHAGDAPLLLVREPAEKRERHVPETISQPQTVESLVGDLASEDGLVRVKARRSLVAMGGKAVDTLIEALKSKMYWVRWEAAKTLAQIGDPTAIQALVDALEDEKFDIRWLAAEGLIHTGSKVIRPLLKALTARPDSLWLREGAHHVLHDLPEADFKQTVKPVLAALEDVQPSLEVALAAEAALDKIREKHS